MLLRIDDIKYLNRIAGMIGKGETIMKKTDHPYRDEGMMFCPECDQEIEDRYDLDHLIMLDASDHPFIAIACEGYHPLDIN